MNRNPKTQHAVTLLLTVRRGTLHHYISPCTIQKVSCMYISVYTICLHRFIHIIYMYIFLHIYTLPKFNIAPEKLPSQKESSLPTIIFQGQAVKLRGGMFTLGNCVSIPQTCLSFPRCLYPWTSVILQTTSRCFAVCVATSRAISSDIQPWCRVKGGAFFLA